MRVLIAEDDLVSRKIMLKILKPYGECDVVMNGIEAVDAVYFSIKEKNPYTLICLDIMMPKIDGLSVLKTIRDLEKQEHLDASKVIMTTALDDEKVVREAFEVGADAYAAKPINKTKFYDVLRKFEILNE
ncbi:response regulator [Acidaminobacter sp. JC074]|uniref:response regulator n=1 Tax=Acidaminobacter sp. JC074 TaxID=2530199 RepID=UPI001F0F0EDA|nr:response regulator [Acidaminobacter sp. JC074]MCH4890787.1 response regulator [Acidaminobacter sp. JC074]